MRTLYPLLRSLIPELANEATDSRPALAKPKRRLKVKIIVPNGPWCLRPRTVWSSRPAHKRDPARMDTGCGLGIGQRKVFPQLRSEVLG